MINLKLPFEFEHLFYPKILHRGYEYYRDNHVEDISKSSFSIFSTVYGVDIYHVEIKVQNNYIMDMDCSCPFARDGNYCKHEAATCYYISDHFDEIPSRNISFLNEKNLRLDIDDFTKNELFKIVQSRIAFDESLHNHVLWKKVLKQFHLHEESLDSLAEAYVYVTENHFINKQMNYFVEIVHKDLSEILITRINNEGVFMLIEYLNSFVEQNMFSSFLKSNQIQPVFEEIEVQILRLNDLDSKVSLVKLKNLYVNGMFKMNNYVSHIIVVSLLTINDVLWKKEYLNELLRHKRIKENSELLEYAFMFFEEHYTNLIPSLAKKHHENDRIKNLYIDYLIIKGHFKKLMKYYLLINQSYISHDTRLQLANKVVPVIREHLSIEDMVSIVDNLYPQYNIIDLESFKKFKEYFSINQWEIIKNDVIAKLRLSSSDRFRILAHERMDDEALRLIETSSEKRSNYRVEYSDVFQYFDDIVVEYPEKVFDIVFMWIQNKFSKPYSRLKYEEGFYLLKKLYHFEIFDAKLDVFLDHLNRISENKPVLKELLTQFTISKSQINSKEFLE